MTRRSADPAKVSRLFGEALALPAAERAAFLDAACAGDAELRGEVDSILRWEAPAGAITGEPLDLPAGGRVGPYVLLRPLGQGGMGVVYDARHAETGARVALKTVAIPEPGLLAGIRREIRSLASLRHPGIVCILDEGVEGGTPWYAMELLEGRTLREWTARPADAASTDRWWTTRLGHPRPREQATRAFRTAADGRLSEVLGLVGRLCVPLSYLHGEGLVHRDLKPDNVVVKADGQPVLVDFGLTAAFGGEQGRDRLELLGEVSGTAAYMSPEQARGESLDARTDVYALGCVLFELLVGHPPYAGTVEEMMLGHQSAEPPRPSAMVSGVPGELDHLVGLMLAKAPHDRLGYADDVAARIARIVPDDGVAQSAPPARAYLYRSKLQGRDDVIAELGGELRRVAEGSGRVVLVGGEGGVGRTRLVNELSGVASLLGMRVLLGECPRDAAVPLLGLRGPLEAVADLCRLRGKAFTDSVLGRRGRLFDPFHPVEGLPGQDAYPPAAPLPAEAARLRLHDAFLETFRQLGAERPVVLLLDDLHWADGLTLGFVAHALRGTRLAGTRLLVVGSFRTDEVAGELAAILAEDSVRKVVLPRLDEGAVAAMVGEMLALAPPPARLSRSLWRQSEGNPYFVAEYLRAALGEGLLRRDGEGRWRLGQEAALAHGEAAPLPLPTTVRGLVARRFEHLGGAARALVEAAAVLGLQGGWMDIELLFSVAGLPHASLLRAWTDVLARQVLETDAAGARCRFVHGNMQEVLYALLSDDRRAALHRDVALAMERLPEGAAPTGVDVGRHWECAGERERARGLYLSAARQALERHALDEAARHFRAHLRLGGPADVPARLELARVLLSGGRLSEAEPELVAARRESEEVGEPRHAAEALLLLGNVLRAAGRGEEARPHLERALDEARALEDLRLQTLVLSGLGGLEREEGHYEAARRCYERAMEMGRGLDHLGLPETLRNDLGVVLSVEGRHREARLLCEEARAVAKATGRRLQEGLATIHLAHLENLDGQLRSSSALLEEAIAIFQEVGTPIYEAAAMHNLAVTMVNLGQLPDARSLAERAAAIHRRAGRTLQGAEMLHTLAGVAFYQGRTQEALAIVEEALAASDELGDPVMRGRILHSLGDVQLLRGEIEEARHAFREASVLCRGASGARERGSLHRSLARLELWHADPVAAQRHFAAARRLQGNGGGLALASTLCLEAHILIAAGGDAADLVARARTILAPLSLPADAELSRELAAAMRARDARASGSPLVCGHRPEDVPEGVASWLRRCGRWDAAGGAGPGRRVDDPPATC